MDGFDPAIIEAALPAFLERMRWTDGGGWITYNPLARGCRRTELMAGLEAFLDAFLDAAKEDCERRLAEMGRNHDYLPRECREG